ncbi:MAG: hypothetical protein CBB87_03505 [Micavibrio sp. TMED27]|nr:hypothetical protein [Micavibrio sp.]OUT91896.1 MAG: hypothetical protein CBB87_03505 [Micavibrio sp. TMED27]|tara:strand:- start:7996 stop:8397 length:402 start_codon:yes stop_codon:yes gene_type:complete
MTRVAGASQFYNAARLSNQNGGDILGQSSTSLLSGFDGTASLLEIGKQFSAPGIGLSANARAITNQFLSQSQAGTNAILSAGAQQTIDSAQQQILAIQARLPASSIGSFAARYDNEGNASSSSSSGGNVDTSA